MEPSVKIPLTAPEISNLWAAYQGDTLARCVLTHFAATAEDPAIKELLQYALGLCNMHIARLRDFFNSDGIPVPAAFSDEDLNAQAPRLYSDSFYLGYLMNFGKQGMVIYAYSIPVSSRRDVAGKHVEVFSSLLRDDHLPAPNIWDDAVTTSTTAPFSEKLMMVHIGGLIATGAVNYGVAAPNSPRRDIMDTYGRLLAEIGKYGEDGVEIMLKHHWMEKVPGAVDRDAIAAK